MKYDKKAYYYLIIGLLFLNNHFLLAQDQRAADSLKYIYAQDKLIDSTKLELLKQLSFNELND